MPDREKVIKGIECCEIKGDCTGCPYDVEQGLPACKQLAIDALALLKEHETVIRCKDCKHATMTVSGELCKYCEMDTDDFGWQREVYHDADWFCADGEKRDDDA